MKLMIRRNQRAQTGLLGGHRGMVFVLTCRVELTPAEQELVRKYQAEMHPLTFGTDRNGNQVAKDTVYSLTKGTTEEMNDITVLLNNEQVVRNACRDFKTLLDVMASFGGEEVVEF